MVATAKSAVRTKAKHLGRKDIEAEQLLKWVALLILTSIVVIGLMKGMLALAVYLIKTLPMSMVS